MKYGALYFLLAVIALLPLSGCGSGEAVIFVSFNGSTDASTAGSPGLTAGFVSVSVTDAKPLLPSGTQEVWITFEEVQVHKEGGDWIPLPLVETPYTIDLLQYHSGITEGFTRPVSLEFGTYDRIKVHISNALVLSNGSFYIAAISPSNLIIEEEFSFDVEVGGLVDLVVDFDLSQSLELTGTPLGPIFTLEPVLHLNHSQEAAVIHGEIAAMTFDDYGTNKAIVTLIMDKDFSGDYSGADEEYTKVIVTRESSEDPTEFSIYWLAPQKEYIVLVEVNGDQEPEHDEFVFTADLQPGNIHDLNNGIPI